MSDRRLQGVGVLVTRPRAQAHELTGAIEAEGGYACRFPVMEIAALDRLDVARRAARLAKPDIVLFVSPNAVEHGIDFAAGARVAVIGPATARAVEAAGRRVDIRPAAGYDSEHLLAEDALRDVAGKRLRIVRGRDGRELLAGEMRRRGAVVDYLSVYDRRLPEVGAEARADLEAQWRAGRINVVTVMSVGSLTNLVELLPEWCAAQLESTPLVTPADRVIKEALKRFPASRPVLAPGPGASDMVQAIIALQATDSGTTP